MFGIEKKEGKMPNCKFLRQYQHATHFAGKILNQRNYKKMYNNNTPPPGTILACELPSMWAAQHVCCLLHKRQDWINIGFVSETQLFSKKMDHPCVAGKVQTTAWGRQYKAPVEQGHPGTVGAASISTFTQLPFHPTCISIARESTLCQR